MPNPATKPEAYKSTYDVNLCFFCLLTLGCEFAREVESAGTGKGALDAGNTVDASEIPEGMPGIYKVEAQN